MTLGNDVPSPEGDGRKPKSSPQESSDIILPSAPRIAHHRILLDAYLENCRRAFIGSNELITDKRAMNAEAPQMFANLATNFRRTLADTLTMFGKADMLEDLTCRMLHPVVAVGKGQPEYHLYVDVVNGRGRCVLPDIDGVQAFNSGPASIQVYVTESGHGELHIGMIRLVSAPAFREAVNDIIAHSFDEIVKNPRGYVAFGWILGGVCNHRRSDMSERRSDRGENPGQVALDHIKNFRWMGGRSPAIFELQIRNAEYKVHLSLDSKAKRPVIVVYEEFK